MPSTIVKRRAPLPPLFGGSGVTTPEVGKTGPEGLGTGRPHRISLGGAAGSRQALRAGRPIEPTRMKVPMLALAREHAEIEPQLARAWSEALAAMRLLKGPHLEAFETEIAAYTGAARAAGVASGTDALALSLIAAGV